MVYITKEGLEKFKKEKEELEKIKRPEVVERIKRAKELGDLSENAEYAAAREEQSFMEGRILELRELVNNAVIIENGKKSKGLISVGSKIKVKTGKIEKEFIITGITEADPINGLISNESPLGKSFLGHKKGDTVNVMAPKGEMKYRILDVS